MGLEEGVSLAGSFILPALQARQQQKQFDASMKRDRDRMALERAWIDARRGVRPSKGDGGQQPHQVTMEADQAPTHEQFMGFSDPTQAATPTPKASDWDPVNAPAAQPPAAMSPAAALAPQSVVPSMGVRGRNSFSSGPLPPISAMRPRVFGSRY